MAEPEDILLDAAHHATTFVRSLWRRRAAGAEPEVLLLADVRQRLELFVTAVYGLSLPIAVAEPPAVPTWIGRLMRRLPRHLIEHRALPATDGTRIRLPRSLRDTADGCRGFGMYRLCAVELAARIVRGTLRYVPGGASNPVRDLFLLQEAAAIDYQLSTELPGLLPDLRAARTAVLTERPPTSLLTPPEEFVEQRLRRLLVSDPAAGSFSSTPQESLERAQEEAAALRTLKGLYRGLPAVVLWGQVLPLPEGTSADMASTGPDKEPEEKTALRVSLMTRRPQVRKAPRDEDDSEMGMWMVQLDDPQEHVEDPMGLKRPTDRDDAADPGDLADSLSELPEARLVATPGAPREVLLSDDPPEGRALRESGQIRSRGIIYPEWDYRIQAYRPQGTVVREGEVPLGDAGWAEAVLTRRAGLLHQVRRRFERLRPRWYRIGRQLDGPDVDISAYVSAYADRRAGRTVDGRLYEAVRPARRDLAIALLVDVSASTDSWISGKLRIIDVEKEALLIVCDALEALGDPYTILAFSGSGPETVSVRLLKGFSEHRGSAVHRRIAALEPEQYTRTGTAIRHATALLTRQAAQHRLLLILSDGKPNDVDQYEGRYGVEDTRQAVAEARLQGLHPYCLTVDRQAPVYMPRIFGPGAYAVLQQPERLPHVLVEVLRRLVRQ